MDYPILSYHSHSFLEQLRRHFQNLDTFLNEILPIDEEKFYFLDEHDNRFIHDGVENLLERLRQRLDHQTKERYINEVSEILHVLDKCFSLEGNYGLMIHCPIMTEKIFKTCCSIVLLNF